MVYLNPRQLALELRDSIVSERTKYRLVLLGFALQLVWGQGLYSGANRGYTLIVLIGAVMYWGIRSCYNANARGDNRAFVERFMCLSVPMSIYFAIASYLVGVTSYRLREIMSERVTMWVWLLAYLALYVIFYRVLRYYIAIAASALSPQTHQQ